MPFLCADLVLAAAREIGVRGLALDRADAMPERYVRVKDGYELLRFLSSQPVELISAIVESDLLLYEKKMNDKGEEIYQVAEKVNLPVGAKGFLVLGWKDEEKYRYLAINDNFSAAKYNNWLMINTTSKPLAVQIGKKNKPFGLKPNQATNYEVESPEGAGAAVMGRAMLEGEVKTFYSTYWPIRKGERSIVIFVERGDRISVKKISDSLFKPKKDGNSDP